MWHSIPHSEHEEQMVYYFTAYIRSLERINGRLTTRRFAH